MPRNSRRDSILAAPPPGAEARRRRSRRAREARQRKLLLISMSALGALLLLIVGFGTLRYYYLIPHQVIATVNSHKIIRSDYWKVRRDTLLDRLQQYSFQAQAGQGDQQSIQQEAQTAQDEITNIRSAPIDPTTLQTMTEDQVVLDALPALGVTITDADVNQTVAERFSPVPLSTPTPSPTLESDEAGDRRCGDRPGDADLGRHRGGRHLDLPGERDADGDRLRADADAEHTADRDRAAHRHAGADTDADERAGPRHLDRHPRRLRQGAAEGREHEPERL